MGLTGNGTGGRRSGGAGSGAQKLEMDRLRREDHLRVKHDKLFSDWKILVGPADWKDHIAGEEGSQRYRLHNLPASYFGPGVYELGLTQHTAYPDAKQRKLRRHAVVVVYLGQADNVRQRLQRYGQSGSHLEGTRSGPDDLTPIDDIDELQKLAPRSVVDTSAKLRGCLEPEIRIKRRGDSGTETSTTGSNQAGGHRLFTEVFSRGYSIAFRWARTESKQVAEKVESELLHVFDYPWNTSLNGARRPRDIIAKLDLLQYQLERSLCLGRAAGMGWRKWEYLSRKVGISVPARKPTETRPAARAKMSPATGGATTASLSVCGLVLEDGSTCGSPPVKGRRRCSAHKGQRVKVLTTMRPKMPPIHQRQQEHSKPAVVIIRAQMQGKRVEITDVSSDGLVVCGAILHGGSPCLNRPLRGRKRCVSHKGIHIRSARSTTAKASMVSEDVAWS